MSTIQKFEDIIAWKDACQLAVMIYKDFGDVKDFAFRNQLHRAAISISNNIAEGYAYGGKKDFIRFLRYSYASVAEVKSMCYIACKLGYLSMDGLEIYKGRCDRLSYLIFKLIKSLKSSERDEKRRN